jgi:hypothetical protein
MILNGYQDVAVSRDARAAIVSNQRLKGQNASRGSCEECALAASTVFAFGPQIGKVARRITGVAGLDIGITTASKPGHDTPFKVASAAPQAAFCDASRLTAPADGMEPSLVSVRRFHLRRPLIHVNSRSLRAPIDDPRPDGDGTCLTARAEGLAAPGNPLGPTIFSIHQSHGLAARRAGTTHNRKEIFQ